MFMDAKISIIFQSSKLFRVKYANLGLSFNRCVIRQDFGQEKKTKTKTRKPNRTYELVLAEDYDR